MKNEFTASGKEALLKGVLRSQEIRRLNWQKKKEDYESNPNKCCQCLSSLEWSKRKNKFCSLSCAAIKNNAGVRRHGTTPILKGCRKCGTETTNESFCSLKCSNEFKSFVYRNEPVIEKSGHLEKQTGICKLCNTPVSKNRQFCSPRCSSQYLRKKTLDKIESSGDAASNDHGGLVSGTKRYIIEKLGHRCGICLETVWMNQPIPLVLDHIDGNPYNSRIDNLRLICCNCDAQTPTYKKKNVGKGRAYRRQRYAEGKSW
jgi:hypothetical protein